MVQIKFADVEVVNLPQEFCFRGSAADILTQIAASLGVKLPASITNVVIGNTEPVNPQVTALWVRTDGAGNFIGLYVVSDGNWVNVNTFTPSIVQVAENTPIGGTLVNSNDSIENVPETLTIINTSTANDLKLTVEFTLYGIVAPNADPASFGYSILVSEDGGLDVDLLGTVSAIGTLVTGQVDTLTATFTATYNVPAGETLVLDFKGKITSANGEDLTVGNMYVRAVASGIAI